MYLVEQLADLKPEALAITKKGTNNTVACRARLVMRNSRSISCNTERSKTQW